MPGSGQEKIFPLGLKPVNGKPYTFMVVDDSRSIRMLLKQILLSSHFDLTGEAGDGVEALKVLQDAPAKPDLLFVDVEMPEMSGTELVQRVKPICPETKIVMVTGHTDEETVRKLISMGISGYIVKPFDRDAVIGRLAKMLGRRDCIPLYMDENKKAVE